MRKENFSLFFEEAEMECSFAMMINESVISILHVLLLITIIVIIIIIITIITMKGLVLRKMLGTL